ncbi:MAG: LynF/TruF/PatF family peptide O-prenyltransferase [Microcystis aeruginosa K13-07]|jgi:LynF/TruF/PatF family peptide O-prenyltransferase|nr:LynF/TruF/PatF family peptide O-prenyltransferase [Microcystis aeruginosa K13-07]
MNCPNLLTARPKNLQFIGEHKNAFDLEYLYPLDLFDNLVPQVEPCRIECSCKIEDYKLDPARFNLAINDSFAKKAQAFLKFFHQVETRVGVTLDYNPLHLFMEGFDYSKVTQIMAGIDARTELAKARVKTWWTIHDYTEKLETAIALSKSDSQALRMLLSINNSLVVGFHLYLMGKSEVRLYPSLDRDYFQKIAVKAQLAKIISPPALELLEDCGAISLVLKEDGDKILHYHLLPERVNSFVDNLHQDMITRAHAPYRDKCPSLGVTVSLSEKELLANNLKTINLYYMNR